jgi:uncharacterized protein YqfB (UPF0267 family)
MVLGFKERFADGEATNFVPKIQDGIKTHTIREDKNGRYKVGTLLHLATGVRTKEYQQFGWGVVTDVDVILICPEQKEIWMYKHGDKKLNEEEVKQLIKNDGFRTAERFWEWFSVKNVGKEFLGKIIHFKFITDGATGALVEQAKKQILKQMDKKPKK